MKNKAIEIERKQLPVYQIVSTLPTNHPGAILYHTYAPGEKLPQLKMWSTQFRECGIEPCIDMRFTIDYSLPPNKRITETWRP